MLTVNSEIFSEGFIFREYAKFRENKILVKIANALRGLPIHVNHALVTIFERRKYVF